MRRCVYCGKPVEPTDRDRLCPDCLEAVDKHTENNEVVVEAFIGAAWKRFDHMLERNAEFTDWLLQHPDKEEKT